MCHLHFCDKRIISKTHEKAECWHTPLLATQAAATAAQILSQPPFPLKDRKPQERWAGGMAQHWYPYSASGSESWHPRGASHVTGITHLNYQAPLRFLVYFYLLHMRLITVGPELEGLSEEQQDSKPNCSTSCNVSRTLQQKPDNSYDEIMKWVSVGPGPQLGRVMG